MNPTADLIAKAEAVARLWDLLLFTAGNPDARQKRADVLHEAILNMQISINAAREGVA